MKYLAIEGTEVLFEFEAESQAGAEAVADMTVFTEMHDCHHLSWTRNGKVIRVDLYEMEEAI